MKRLLIIIVLLEFAVTQTRVYAGITDGQTLTIPTKDPEKPLRENMPLQVGFGSYPDIAADSTGMLHLVYARDGKLFYRTYNPISNLLSPEQYTTLNYLQDKYSGPGRSDPEVMVDNKGSVHVFVGQEYACWNGKAWVKTKPGVARDTDMGISRNGDVFITKRGGNKGGHIGVVVKKANNVEFEATPNDPDIGTDKGVEWMGKGDHVYGSLFIDDHNVVHLVYRQAKPEYVSYRRSDDYGKTWKGCGVYGGDEWQGEAADIAVTPEGKVFVVSHDGVLFALDNSSFSFTRECKILNCHERELPSLSVGSQNRVCVTAFGGIYNFLHKDKPVSEKKLPAITGKPIGFAESVFAGTRAWAIYEEGDLVSKEDLAGVSAIFLTEIHP